jgi:iron complex outermembrane receptor protein
MIRNVLHTLGSLRTALVAAVGLPFLIGASAYAQDPNAAPNAPVQSEATTERVIVTGSYIPTAETESALPVTVYTAEVLRKQGANTPVEGLRQLPSFVGNTITENDSNGGNGQAFITLRGLGPANTLTLINGRRAFEFADINAIGIGSLSRTEVLKDGASAIYGSDAVAGVVNFILLNGPGEKPYEGAELFALYGNTTDTDAHVRQVYLRGGVTGLDGKVSIAASGEYYSRANLFSRDRDIATTGDTSNNPTGQGWGGLNNNSPTFGGRVSVAAAGSTGGGPTGALVLINLSNNQVTPTSYRPFDVPAGTDPSRFNFRAFTPAIPAVEKAMYYVTGRYKIFGDGLQMYGDIMYTKSKQDNGLAAAPFTLSNAFNGRTEARASIFNPFGDNLNSVAYRTVQELGLRKSFYDRDYHRYVIGFNGDFNIPNNSFVSRFGYDTGFVYEDFLQIRTDSGDAVRTGLRNLIAANIFNPFIGVSAPITGTAPTYINGVPTGMTAPYDNSQAAQLFTNGGAQYIGHSLFKEHDYLYDARANAHFAPGWWNGGFDLAVGYEHRNIHQQSIPDPVQAGGDQLGFNQAPNTKTTQEVNSVFAELAFPIITSTMNVPFVRSLDVTLAWRYEKFDDSEQLTKQTASFDNINEEEDFHGTPRIAIRYQPTPDLTLRAGYNQSFLSPTPSSLFDPVGQNFPVLFDPRNAVTLQPPEGVWQGGNSQLLPEKTDTYTAGVVYTPKWLPGFTMTADWYQIFTTDLILSPANFAQVLLSNGVIDPDGFGNGSGDPAATGGPADGATYDPVTGLLTAVDADFGNAGRRFVQGLDVTAVYELPTERWGKFTFSGGWNHFFTWKAEADPTQGFHNFLGDYNNGTFPLAPGAIPFNKGFLRGEWEWRHWDFVATGNYIGDFEDDPNFILGNDFVPGSPGTGAGDPPPANPEFILHRRVTSYITLDMQLSYEWVKPPTEPAPFVKESKDSKSTPVTEATTASIWQRMLWGTKIAVGVNNAFDRRPPSVIGAFNDNYDTSLYSIRNRYWYVSLTKKF